MLKNELDGLAGQIRAEYIKKRDYSRGRGATRITPREDRPEIWSAAAQDCSKTGLSAFEYVEIAFKGYGKRTIPQQLAGQAILRLCEEMKSSFRHQGYGDEVTDSEKEMAMWINHTARHCGRISQVKRCSELEALRNRLYHEIPAYVRVTMDQSMETWKMWGDEACVQFENDLTLMQAAEKHGLNINLLFQKQWQE